MEEKEKLEYEQDIKENAAFLARVFTKEEIIKLLEYWEAQE